MKTILFMAISVDGKTTGPADDVSWVEQTDIGAMDELMVSCGVMIMGSTTYRSFGDDLPNDRAVQVVMTHDQSLLQTSKENVIFTDQSPAGVLRMLAEKGFSSVMLAGGQTLNTSFLQEGLLDEIWLIRKPVILGTGKSLVIGDTNRRLQLIETSRVGDASIQVKYKVA